MAWRRARYRAHAETPRPGVVRQPKVAADPAVQEFATRDNRLTLDGFSGFASKLRFPRRRPRIGRQEPDGTATSCAFLPQPLSPSFLPGCSSTPYPPKSFTLAALRRWASICNRFPDRCPLQSYAPENAVQNQLFVHFGLRENPFGVTPDPRFLFHSETHREALASLINGIDCGFGFQVLVAQPGMGKTTLLFNFLERFRATASTAFLFQPQLEPHELLQSLLFELGSGSEDTSVRKLSEQINQLLGRAAEEGKRVIVVVDEAQNLDFAMLETLRQLSNFETTRVKLMQIILAGQPQLVKILAASEQEQLRQRISSIGRLSPLRFNETRPISITASEPQDTWDLSSSPWEPCAISGKTAKAFPAISTRCALMPCCWGLPETRNRLMEPSSRKSPETWICPASWLTCTAWSRRSSRPRTAMETVTVTATEIRFSGSGKPNLPSRRTRLQ